MDKTTTTLNVRSSAAEFLIFSMQEEADTIEVLYQDENLWLTQKNGGTIIRCGIQHHDLSFKRNF